MYDGCFRSFHSIHGGRLFVTLSLPDASSGEVDPDGRHQAVGAVDESAEHFDAGGPAADVEAVGVEVDERETVVVVEGGVGH